MLREEIEAIEGNHEEGGGTRYGYSDQDKRVCSVTVGWIDSITLNTTRSYSIGKKVLHH